MYYDAVVVGAGHAGCEAALALARKGHKTLILTINLDNVAFLACNPSIGGTAKGHIVREIDALGGEMGLCADETLMQLRMLNLGKGVAVHSLRAQTDKFRYHERMKRTLEEADNLRLLQGEVVEITAHGGKVSAVVLATGERFETSVVVLATGVYLSSDIIMGEYKNNLGPNGFAPANRLTACLADLGFNMRRFKTGTPARVDKRSLDFSKMERQEADKDIYSFSFMTENLSYQPEPCYLTYTTQKTHDIIKQNIDRAPMYSGLIKGVGPRYCPSIETKIVRFADKERHQIFIEPEGRYTNEMYVQGMSTSMPVEVQQEMYRSVIGLENVVIMRYAYAIEYDCINPAQIDATLKYKAIDGLYTAGQINGSSGYEEAAGQGLVAGINAALYLENREPFILRRSDAYIGVLIDDLVTKGTEEPYRMMTSRAEYRLLLRQDNADSRLTEMGRAVNLVSDKRYERYLKKQADIAELMRRLSAMCKLSECEKFLKKLGDDPPKSGMRFQELLKRTNVTMREIESEFGIGKDFSEEVKRRVETEVKYAGYIDKQRQEVEKAEKLESRALSKDFDYSKIKGLRLEAVQKLNEIKPLSIGQAARISGVSPADVAVLIVYLAGETNER